MASRAVTAILASAVLGAIAFSSCAERGSPAIEPPESSGPSRIRSYLERTDRLRTAKLVLREEWFTDVVPPGGGTNTWEIELDGERVRWSWRRDNQVGSDAEASGESPRAQGLPKLVEVLRRLDQAGWWTFAAGVPDPDLHFLEGHTYSVALEMDGELGVVEVQRSLPFAISQQPSSAPLVEAFRQASARLARDP